MTYTKEQIVGALRRAADDRAVQSDHVAGYLRALAESYPKLVKLGDSHA